MRTIKFRGKRCSDGEWVYGYYLESTRTWNGHKPHKSWILCDAMTNGGFFSLLGRYPVKDDTVCQSTGLYDKAGKEIYEGDIVIYRDEIVFDVKFHHGGFGYTYCLSDFLLGGNANFKFNPDDEDENFEIIGNIYDQPELLKGGAK